MLADILAEGARALQLPLSKPVQQRLQQYIALLEKWNRVYNLTAIRDPLQMMTYHVLDSLAALPMLPDSALRLLDVGSGGGLPGMVFAITRPQWQVTLLDSNQKKTAFLRQAVIDLGLTNVAVVTARVEQYQSTEKFTLITSRAFSTLKEWVTLSQHLLADGGRYVAMKGALPAAEIAQLPTEVRVEHTQALHVPGLQAARHLVIMRAST